MNVLFRICISHTTGSRDLFYSFFFLFKYCAWKWSHKSRLNIFVIVKKNNSLFQVQVKVGSRAVFPPVFHSHLVLTEWV